MPEDKPSLIERIHGILGLKASPEQQAEIDRIEREGKAANARLKAALNDRLENTRARVNADAEDIRRRQDALEQQLREDRLHRPKDLAMVSDISSGPDGRPNMQLLHKWDDGYGNTVYTANTRADIAARKIVTPDQIQPLSRRIQAQQASFAELGADEQTLIRTEFDSSKAGVAEGIRPYDDFLQSEALGKRFQEIQQSRPTPK